MLEASGLIQPKEFTITTQEGKEKTYILSKFPAVAGREIVAKYPLSGMPKLGDYNVNEETMLKLMAYVAVMLPNGPQRLTMRALIDSHVPDWETLATLEMAMMEYNCSFFSNGKASIFLKGLSQKVSELISKTLTESLEQSLQKAKPPSMNSEQSTA